MNVVLEARLPFIPSKLNTQNAPEGFTMAFTNGTLSPSSVY